MARKSSLGMGLNELLSNVKLANQGFPSAKKEAELQQLSIELLRPGKYQPRTAMVSETLEELAHSIRNQGIVQPLVVRSIGGGNYEIIAGERRWRAAQLAGLDRVPVVIRELADQQAVAVALIENIQREDLNVVDMALGIQRLIDEFTMTHDDAATVIGKSRAMVTNLLRLLVLPEEVREMLRLGDLDMGHARTLLTLDRSEQLRIARMVVEKKLSVRSCEQLVQQLKSAKVRKKVSTDPNITMLQRELADKLATRVALVPDSKGGGRIVIRYHSLDELDGILGHIR